MSIEIKKLEVQLANVKAARLGNELKIDELGEVIAKLKKDVQISLSKEDELALTIKNKQGE